VTTTPYVPLADRAGAVVYVQLPALHGAVPFCVAGPVIEIATVALSPAPVEHAPPTDVTEAFVEKGNVRGVPLTVVIVTAGAVTSMTIDCPPLVPVFPALSVCVAVTV
jgi:hypothetical protein